VEYLETRKGNREQITNVSCDIRPPLLKASVSNYQRQRSLFISSYSQDHQERSESDSQRGGKGKSIAYLLTGKLDLSKINKFALAT